MHQRLTFLDDDSSGKMSIPEDFGRDDDPYLIHDLCSFMEQHPFKVKDHLASFEDEHCYTKWPKVGSWTTRDEKEEDILVQKLSFVSLLNPI